MSRSSLRRCDSFGSQALAPQSRREASLVTLSRTPSIPPSSPFETSIRGGLKSQMPTEALAAELAAMIPRHNPVERHNSVEGAHMHHRSRGPSGLPNTWVAGGPDVSMGMSMADPSVTGAAGAAYQAHFRITEGDVAVETFLVMEYADQGSLDKRIAAGALKGKLVPILLCALDVASGMQYLHAIGVLHSDLKAGNVLLRSAPATPHDPRGFICKIADFGMSRLLMEDASHVSTNTHGTVAYVGPEVLQRGAIAMPADVYSFAMLLMELWTGDVIYKGVNYHQVLYTVFSGQKPKVPDDMPAELRDLMIQCWSTEPGQRPTFKDISARIRTMLAAARGTDLAAAAAATNALRSPFQTHPH